MGAICDTSQQPGLPSLPFPGSWHSGREREQCSASSPCLQCQLAGLNSLLALFSFFLPFSIEFRATPQANGSLLDRLSRFARNSLLNQVFPTATGKGRGLNQQNIFVNIINKIPKWLQWTHSTCDPPRFPVPCEGSIPPLWTPPRVDFSGTELSKRKQLSLLKNKKE